MSKDLVLKEKNENMCDKCGAGKLYAFNMCIKSQKVKYDYKKDLMEIICWKCGYKWNALPLDKKDD